MCLSSSRFFKYWPFAHEVISFAHEVIRVCFMYLSLICVYSTHIEYIILVTQNWKKWSINISIFIFYLCDGTYRISWVIVIVNLQNIKISIKVFLSLKFTLYFIFIVESKTSTSGCGKEELGYGEEENGDSVVEIEVSTQSDVKWWGGCWRVYFPPLFTGEWCMEDNQRQFGQKISGDMSIQKQEASPEKNKGFS